MESKKYDYRQKYNFQKEWEEYRKRRNLHYLIFFSGIIFFPLGMWYFKLIGLDETNSLLHLFLFAVWGSAFLYNLSRFNTWRCPHCKERFFTSSFWASDPTMIGECRHCDLPKYYGSNFYKSKMSYFPKIKD
jgi:hypothetical protein